MTPDLDASRGDTDTRARAGVDRRAPTGAGEQSAASRPRATSSVVGVALLVGATAALAAGVGALVATQHATGPAPQVRVAATLDATDGWPEGQRLELVHRAGDPLVVADLAVVVAVERVDGRTRLTGFPTRRLTGANVRGAALFDNGYAGVDGELDAAHTDGVWTSGETATLRLAQEDVDLVPGDRVRVRVVHRPTNAVLVYATVRAAG